MKRMLQVAPFQETLNAGMCGPASLKIVLDYYEIGKSEEKLAKLCSVDKNLGVNDQTIKEIAENLGFQVQIKNNSSFSDIEGWLKKDTPVIVDWFTRGRTDYDDSVVADGHYSVVCGLDNNNIYLQDPEIGKIRKINKEDFKTVWFDFTGKYINSKELIIRQCIIIY